MNKFLRDVNWAIDQASSWRGSLPPDQIPAFDARIKSLIARVAALRQAWKWFEQRPEIRKSLGIYKVVTDALK